MAQSIVELLGNSLRSKKGQTMTSSITAEVIGIYFSAHWCPPCRAFTPKLVDIYNEAHRQGKSFEVVFVSSDRDEASFEEYYRFMPWLAVDIKDVAAKKRLSGHFQVSGIPKFVLLDRTGRVLDADGRNAVLQPSFLSSLPQAVDESMKGVVIDDVLQSLEDDREMTNERRRVGFQTICNVITNVLKHIGDPQFLTLKKDNRSVQTKLGHFDFIRLLKLAGFREHGDVYRCPEDPDRRRLREVREILSVLLLSLETEAISTSEEP